MMNFFFGTRLAYLLNGENYESQIKSLEQVRERKFYIAPHVEIIKIWIQHTSTFRHYPDNYYVNCDERECVHRMKEKRNMAFVGSERLIRDIEKKSYPNPPMVVLDEHLEMAHLYAFFSKGYPLFPLINSLVLYLVQSGIIPIMSEKYDKVLQIYDEPLTMKSLSLEHMVLPLSIWIIGNFLSLVVLYFEKIKFKHVVLKN
ncbi:hypothetical protein HHI36_019565 [Cryptolaemus montrouzieri]|uniref:Uncharacterized protein n=1 Tax=Cryptolaemus montrouzieri TaxID=559131 RepID=A0ABD2N857_9CUCU